MQATTDQRRVLAVDLGTSGCKCALVGLDGTVHAWAFRPVALHVQGQVAEQSPHDWWSAFIDSANELLGADPGVRRQVVAVCCSTQNEVTVCVDRAGQPEAPRPSPAAPAAGSSTSRATRR
jgi:xylulokinase